MLYHEKQVAALCGVHCLNTLLQGPYFSEIELAQIALGLDELERSLVDGGALGEASGNVAMDGMFSIQVLSRALETWGLQVASLESEEAVAFKAAPATAPAYICNLHEHWFTLRRVAGGDWWNFNSLFPAPQPLSGFYLQAFMDTLRGEGWTIFVVLGPLPTPQPGAMDAGPAGRWWSPEEARAANEEAERARKRGRLNAALEDVFEQADRAGGALTLRSRGAGPSGQPAGGAAAAAAGGGGAYGSDGDDDEDADLAAAIAASLHDQHPGHAHQGRQQVPAPVTAAAAAAAGRDASGAAGQGRAAAAAPPAAGGGGGEALYEDDDPELAAAIAASLADVRPAGQDGGEASTSDPGAGSGAGARSPAKGDAAAAEAAEEEAGALGPEPEEGEGVIEIAFRLPSGSRASRRFHASDPSTALFAFAAPLLGLPPCRLALFSSFPKQELPRLPAAPLSSLGLGHRTLLLAEARSG